MTKTDHIKADSNTSIAYGINSGVSLTELSLEGLCYFLHFITNLETSQR